MSKTTTVKVWTCDEWPYAFCVTKRCGPISCKAWHCRPVAIVPWAEHRLDQRCVKWVRTVGNFSLSPGCKPQTVPSKIEEAYRKLEAKEKRGRK